MAYPTSKYAAQTPIKGQLKSALSRIVVELADPPLRRSSPLSQYHARAILV